MSRFTDHLGLRLLEQPNGDPVLTEDGRCQWMLEDPLTYDLSPSVAITVPAGAPTDLASIPRFAWSIGFPADGPWTKAAVIHDFLYRTRGTCRWNLRLCVTGRKRPFTRAESDAILRDAMKVLGVGAWQRLVIWLAVRLGGASGWGR